MCSKHELSAAVHTSAPLFSTSRSLSDSIAIEVSAFFTANVPPKPQHSAASSQLDEIDPAHVLQQPPRAVPDPHQPHRVTSRVQRDLVRKRGADVLHPQPVNQELGQLGQPPVEPAPFSRR